MPFIHTQVSVKLSKSDEEQLKLAFGKGISLLPGKSEEYLMLRFDGDAHLYFAGSDAPCAMVEVSLFGREVPKEAEGLTTYITAALAEVLGIVPNRIYVKYAPVTVWGMDGEHF